MGAVDWENVRFENWGIRGGAADSVAALAGSVGEGEGFMVIMGTAVSMMMMVVVVDLANNRNAKNRWL